MEDNSNSFDSASIIKELQTLNKGINDVNTSQEELMQYLLSKDKAEQEEKEQAQKQEEEIKELQQKEAEEKEEQTKAAENKADSQTETYTELLTQTRDELRLNNQLISGSFIFYGIICGIILFKVLWDKLT